MNDHVELGASILTAVIGVAILAVIFSKKANTSGVIQAAGSAFGGILGIAVSPITGTSSPSPGGQSVQFTNPGGVNVNFPNLNFPNVSIGGVRTTSPPNLGGGSGMTF